MAFSPGVPSPRPRQRACATLSLVTYEALLDEAKALPEEQRAALVQELNATLAPRGVEEAWAEEVARRVEELRSGTVETIPADVVIARAREALRTRRALTFTAWPRSRSQMPPSTTMTRVDGLDG